MHYEKKILVIQTAFPGDAILTLPFIQELKRKKPDYLIEVLCIPSTGELFVASPFINSVIVLDKKGKHKSFTSFLKFVEELKSNCYEIVYSPHRSFRSTLITLKLSPKESYGFDNSSMKFVYKNIVKYDHTSHEVKRNLNLLDEDYRNDKWKIIPEIFISNESRLKVQKFLADNRIKKFVTIAPGSVWETKKYPKEYYKKIIDHFKKLDFQILLIGGSDDKELCEDFRKNDDTNIFIAAGEFSFIESIELLKKTCLLVCNDSAPTHLGVCADIPVLTIYCSTIPGFGFYPYNDKSDFVSLDELFCKPCGIHGYDKCPLDHFNCGNRLLPETVIQKAVNLLSDES